MHCHQQGYIGLFIIINTQQNEVISKKHSKSLPHDSKEFIDAPFISSSNIIGFKLLQRNEYNLFVEKCKFGLDVNCYNSHICCMNEKLPEHLVDATLIFDEMPDYHGLFKYLQMLALQLLTVHSKPSIKGL